ncbi:MAG: hypothetical protein DSY37_03065 [Hyperthermus sp.]|nr:MAG: hypothetical protein DSY37_03065 [Hyperthermus sp.]
MNSTPAITEARSRLEEGLEKAKLILEAIARGEYCCLRHGLPYITPSILYEQAFCEMKLHLRLSKGAPSNARPSTATILLRELLRTKHNTSGIISPPMAATILSVPIIARPPALAVKDCVHAIYIAASFNKRPYHPQLVKAYAYAAIAHSLGIACNTMHLAFVSTRNPNSLKQLINLIQNPLKPKPTKIGDAKIVTMIYDHEKALAILSRLLAYWTMKREPQARKNSYCPKCPFNTHCTL